MFRKKRPLQPYDKNTQIPVIRASICNGEQIAGFRNIQTGQFSEVMLIREHKDLEDFLIQYGVDKTDIKKEW